MNTRTILVLAVCALLFVSSIDAKKPAKGDKKAAKEKTEKTEKVKKVKAEKVVVVEEPEVVHETVPEVVHHHAHEEVEEAEEVIVEKQVAQQQHRRISPPKSLKVASAYETCKLECRKQRDAVHAADYVEQLRAELASAESALAAEQNNAPVAEVDHAPVENQ